MRESMFPSSGERLALLSMGYSDLHEELTLTYCRQFGNMLVLATVYQSKRFGHLVPRDKLEHLFERTINFLGTLRPISKTLGQDVRILETMRDAVLNTPDRGHSFSSNEQSDP